MTQPEPIAEFPSDFIFVVCQHGAEAAARAEILANHPNLKLAFSRPGFVTFKVDPGTMPLAFTLTSTLARTSGWSAGKLVGDDAQALATQLVDATNRFAGFDRVHVFERDPAIPGKNHFEPGVSPLAAAVAGTLKEACQEASSEAKENRFNTRARQNERVYDVVLVEPGQWWHGYHVANSIPGRWPGGVPQLNTTQEVYSRAYFKLEEALLWSGIRIRPGDVCAELGSAPGGACQLLLEKGASVLAIDPAEMEPELLEHPQLTHLRRRSGEVRKRDLKSVRWLLADMNIDPDFTLEAVAGIVGHDSVHVKGMILTMKLSEWSLVEKVPQTIERVKQLGFQIVKTRQLAFNRREYCLVAIKNRFVLRDGKRK